MFQRILLTVALLVFASGVLVTSILRTVSPTFVFSQVSKATPSPTAKAQGVEYYLAYPGILPDHFLWPAKAARDRIWLFLTTDPLKKSELLLLLADKGIGAAQVLAQGGKPELAGVSAQKAEKYLEEAVKYEEIARNKGADVDKLLDRLALATLKHREILEEMYKTVPEGVRPSIVEALTYPKKLLDQLRGTFRYQKKEMPESPFGE